MKAPALHRKVQGIHPEGRAQDQQVPCRHRPAAEPVQPAVQQHGLSVQTKFIENIHPQKYIYGFNGLAYTSFDFNWNFGFIHSPKTVIILNQ